MTEAVKIAAAGIICAVLVLLVRQLRPELAPFLQTGGIIVIAVMIAAYIKSVIEKAAGIFEEADAVDAAYLSILVKVLAVAVITRTGADMCADSGNSALKSCVELAGKVLILAMCFPMIEAVVKLAGGLLK